MTCTFPADEIRSQSDIVAGPSSGMQSPGPGPCLHMGHKTRTAEAGLQGLRFHDLRHTVITELAEMGVADHVLESISGHLSRRMLEHYSHIRIDARRQALVALDVASRATAGNGENPPTRPRSKPSSRSPPTSRHSHVHSLRLSGSPAVR